MNIFALYFDGRDDLLGAIKLFDTKHHAGLVASLNKETKETDFLSTITEINFGLFFDKISNTVQYNKTYENLTPDWTLTINGQNIIAEVLRLNPSSSDKVKLDFDNDFMEAMHQIMVGCFLSFDYDEKEIKRENIDIPKCTILVEKWLKTKPAINDTLVLFDTIELQIISYPPNIDHTCLAGGGGSINFDYRRLKGDRSTLLRKTQKYSSIIENYNLPYIVCIYMDFHTWFKKDDLYTTLYGLSTEHEAEINFLSHNIENALYYANTIVRQNVSGVLLRQNDEFTYYHNFSKSNKLNNKNQEIFLAWQHPYE